MARKNLTFLLYDFNIEYHIGANQKNVSTSLSIEDFINNICQNCYNNIIKIESNDIQDTEETNIHEYKDLIFLSHENSFLFGKIRKGWHPWRPNVVNTETSVEEDNPRSENQIEPKTSYFFIKMYNSDPIKCYIYLESKLKSSFIELFKPSLFNINDIGLYYKNDFHIVKNINTYERENVKLILNENFNIDILDKITRANRIMEINVETEEPINNLEADLIESRGEDLNKIIRNYTIKVKRGGSLLLKLPVIKNFINNDRIINDRHIKNLRFKIKDANNNLELINLEHIQNKLTITTNLTDEQRNVIDHIDVYNKIKQQFNNN